MSTFLDRSCPCLFSVLYLNFVVIIPRETIFFRFPSNKKESENSLKYGDNAPLRLKKKKCLFADR